MNNIALLIVYNHRYDKNIERLETIYHGRFSNIYHLMPFYDGHRENVITVYDSSYQFQGYIAQAFEQLKGKGFSHFIVVADDLVINPCLNENNFFEQTGILPDACFDYEIKDMSDMSPKWFHAKDAVKFSLFNRGLEIKNILPAKEEAATKLKAHGYHYQAPCEWPYTLMREPVRELLLRIRRIIQLKLRKKITFSYPLLGGYSDMIVVPAGIMPRFCQYCGAFAAARLFVEIAIPTAMVLAGKKVQTIEDIKMNETLILPKQKDKDFLPQCNHSYDKLIASYPSNILFIHPVKLSQWK